MADMRETALEAVFRQRVRLLGGMAIKLAPTVKGLPDRLVLLPGGGMFLVELKTETGVLSAAQREWHRRVTLMGVKVETLYGPDEVRVWALEKAKELDAPAEEAWAKKIHDRKSNPGNRPGRPKKHAEASGEEHIIDRSRSSLDHWREA